MTWISRNLEKIIIFKIEERVKKSKIKIQDFICYLSIFLCKNFNSKFDKVDFCSQSPKFRKFEIHFISRVNSF